MSENSEDSLTETEMCAVCQGDVVRPAVLDPCLHRFCYSCIQEWARRKRECPLCKANFEKLMYDINSDDVYKTFYFESRAPQPTATFTNTFRVLNLPAGNTSWWMSGANSIVTHGDITDSQSGTQNRAIITKENVSQGANVSIARTGCGSKVVIKNVTSDSTLNIDNAGPGCSVNVDGLHSSTVTIKGLCPGCTVTVQSISSAHIKIDTASAGSSIFISNVSNNSNISVWNVGVGGSVVIQGVPGTTRRTYPVQNSNISVRNVGIGARFTATNSRNENIEVDYIPTGQHMTF